MIKTIQKSYALILAAGKGSRLREDCPKQYLPLGDKFMVEWSLFQFQGNNTIDKVFLVVDPSDKALYTSLELDGVELIEAAGQTRQETVLKALDYLEQENDRPDFILIHDSARPFVDDTIIDSCVSALKAGEVAVFPALECVDTVREKTSSAQLKKGVVDRSKLLLCQTPQAFKYQNLCAAYANVDDLSILTDDISVIEQAGEKPKVIKGSRKNFKVTTQFDYHLAQMIAASKIKP